MDELLMLLQGHLEGTLDPQESRELEKRLRNDPQARRLLAETYRIDEQLRSVLPGERRSLRIERMLADNDGKATPAELSRTSSAARSVVRFFVRPTPFSLAVAALVIGFLITAMAFLTPPVYRALVDATSSARRPSHLVVARLTGLHRAAWKDDSNSFHQGAFLVAGARIALRGGVAQVSYDNGATVVLEGPCDYAIDSDNTGSLASGRLSAVVTEGARGFTVGTPLVTVADLGTEFGVAVTNDNVDVVVFKGVVETRSLSGDARRLTIRDNQAYRFSAESAERIAASSIPIQRDFSAIVQAAQQETAQRYRKAILDEHPSAYWPLDDFASLTCADVSGNEIHARCHAVKLRSLRGPWGGAAPLFQDSGYPQTEPTSRLLPENGLTVEAWIWANGADGTIGRVASYVDCWGLGLRHADGSCRIRFTHWRIKDYDFETTLPRRRWMYVAVTVDEHDTARVFINGQLREELPGLPPLRPTSSIAVLGASNAEWGEPWRGGLAHVAVYPRALTARQLQNHFQIANSPPPD